jgi:translation elongation factor EF-1alpha
VKLEEKEQRAGVELFFKMEYARRVDFTQIMPTEVLFNICFNLTRTDLGICASICKKMRPVCLYILEHKRKIRLVDDALQVIFVSLPESGKSTLVKTLAQQKGVINRYTRQPPYKITAPVTYYLKLETKSNRGNFQMIGLTETPNGSLYNSMTWTSASQCDLCVFVMNGKTNEPKIEEDKIKELITGVCHMMSSRDVIVAINIKGNDPLAEKIFREKRAIITNVLSKSIGPCYDVIPVDASQNIGVFSTSKFPWFGGSALWPMIVENQKRDNYDKTAIERIRNGPFEFQIASKCRVKGVGSGVVCGRILSGSITAKTDDIVPIRCIPHRDAEIRSIESCMTTVTTAAAGDYVGLNLRNTTTRELRKKFGFIWCHIDPIWKNKVLIDITLAFRMQFVVMEPKLMSLHEVYKVHYGAHRIHCVLLWIFPSKSYKTSKDSKQFRSGKAIMVPLERVPMRVYKANEFQKNIHGKVMLTQGKGAIAAIGRIDKTISVKMEQVPMAVSPQDYIALYDLVIKDAKKLFDENEDKLLDSFLEHLRTDHGARNSITRFNKRTTDRHYYEKND